MQITKQIRIDMANRQLTETVYAVQGDSNTRIISAMLLENNIPWEVPTGVTAAVAFQKPDKTKGLYDHLPDGSPAISISGNVVKAILAPQVLSCSGEVRASIVFHDSDLTQLATFPFYIDVAENPAAGQSVSNDYYRYSTMEEVSEAVEAALAALEAEKQDFLDKAEEALAVVHDTAVEAAPAIVCEASGEVISAADASDRPLKGLSIYGKTVQNGTPTPENPVPLESVGESIAVKVCGKNLLPYPYADGSSTTHNGITYTVNADGSITANGTATATSNFNLHIVISPFQLKKGERYVYSGCPKGGSHTTYRIRLQDVSYTQTENETGNGVEFTARHESYYAWIDIKAGTTVNNLTFYPMIRIASTGAEFEPYKGQTLTASTPNGLPGIPVASGGNYTDSTGQQWISDEIDFARGIVTKKVISEVLQLANVYNAYGLYCILQNNAMTNKTALCTHAPVVWTTNDPNLIRIPLEQLPTSVIDVVTGQKWLNNNSVVVQYPLAEPIETALSPEELAQYAALHSNKPNTTVFNDAGAGMKLEYVADTKSYIDQKLAAISAAVLNA